MAYQLHDLLVTSERLWPIAGAETWDVTGIVSGAVADPLRSLVLAVDVTRETVDEAISLGADALLVHHPMLLRGVTSIAEERYKGALLAKLVRAKCALISAHTNADVVRNGTSDVLAAALKLNELRPLAQSTHVSATTEDGLGRFGILPSPTALGALARVLADILPSTASGIRVAGDYGAQIQKVALCAGAGDSLLNNPIVQTADVFITSDLRHHPASEAREQAIHGGGPALIDVSHWASEWLWLDVAATQIRSLMPELIVSVSELRTDPWDFQIPQ